MKFILLAFASLILSCSNNISDRIMDLSGNESLLVNSSETLRVQIVDHHNLPLLKAKALLGLEYDPNQLIEADTNGYIEIPRSEIVEDFVLTIDAPGFVRATYINLTNVDQKISLRPKSLERNLSIGGVTTGFGSLKKDKWADFSMVAPVFTKAQLIGFDLSYVISDQMDTMKVYGREVSIPSNISFPRQKENYGFFPITLDKPSYTMPFAEKGSYELAALHGRFPFKKVVGKLRDGESVFDVINDFDFKQIGITEVQIDSAKQTRDLPIDQISFAIEKEFKSPALDQGEVFLAVALNAKEESFFPSGIKRLNQTTAQKLHFAEDHDQHLLLVSTSDTSQISVKASLSSEVSIQVLDLSKGESFNLLDKVAKPEMGQEGLKLFKPSDKNGITSTGTYLVLSAKQDLMNPHLELSADQNHWEVYADHWLDALKLPNWPTGINPLQSGLRWEVMFLGSSQGPVRKLGPLQIFKSSHVTRNTVEY